MTRHHPPCQAHGVDTNSASVVLLLPAPGGQLDGSEATWQRVLLEAGQALHSEIVQVPPLRQLQFSGVPPFVRTVSPRVAAALLGVSASVFPFRPMRVCRAALWAAGDELLRAGSRTGRCGCVAVERDFRLRGAAGQQRLRRLARPITR